ncbi:hypothetical protein [Pectobacterium zantedeschiae]|uniref:hypothetical protein n=1 Tax=Pectobacterium zantedeschiae TaxID=2034769 RepID=UPI00101C7AC8|nr:hypothetical protein [Pectobacterium zantedeschiae]RYC36991.1 hypothetical protein DEH81_22490 [Pectobacterium zantedeschiae]
MVLRVTHTALVEAVFQESVSAEEIREWLAHIENLLESRQPFFFIASTLAHTEFSPNYRSIQAFWYRQHKPAFQRYCRGLVRIARNASEQARLDTPALHRTWGVPYFVTLDKSKGYNWIAERMMDRVNDDTNV